MKEKNKKQNLPETVVGLDIGTTKIAAIIGQKDNEGKIRVLGYGKGISTGVQNGLVFNVKKTVDGIRFAIDSAEKRSELNISEVFVGVAGRHIRSKEFKYSFLRLNGKYNTIQQEEIDKVINNLFNISVNAAETIITVIPQRYVIDEKRVTTDPVGELGEQIEGYFQIVTSDKYEIEKIIKSVKDSGLTIQDITLEPIASSLSCLSEEEKREGVAMVDIGGGTSDLAIYYGNNLVYTKVIPIGGQIITRDIAQICHITEEQAEQIKTIYGSCVPENSNRTNMITIPHFGGQPVSISEENLAKIIQARVKRDIVDKVKQAIDESGYKDNLYRGIVLTGGGSLLHHIKELFIYVTQLQVRLAIPDIGFSSFPNELRSPVFSTSLGLLKYGIQEEKLLNTELGEKEMDANDTGDLKTGQNGQIEDKTPTQTLTIFRAFKSFYDKLVESSS
ncbi:MAG: cell division protein FtsA [Bacteroidales bacterium]|jgi:cell division protein FtsA|nr:cell division protein FtsA [Bacteroidales bacterium]